MDRIEKALRKLTKKERRRVKTIVQALSSQNWKGLDIKRLQGREDIFRVRKRDIRIIFRVDGGSIFLLAIERRSEKTYRQQ